MREVIVSKTDGSIDFLKDYRGHVFLGFRPHATCEGLIVLQFSDEAVKEEDAEK